MSLSREKQLRLAVIEGRADQVAVLLKDGDVDVNVADEDSHTVLINALRYNHHNIVPILLTVPNLMVNKASHRGLTPLMYASHDYRLESAINLLMDLRVEVNIQDNLGATALWCAAAGGEWKVITWIFACRPFVATALPIHQTKKTPLESAQAELSRYCNIVAMTSKIGEYSDYFNKIGNNYTNAVDTIRDYVADPIAGRQRALCSPIVRDYMIPYLFAMMVFFTGHHLKCNNHDKTSQSLNAMRFFTMTARLPMELQMVLCHRVFGSSKTTITSKAVEPHFRTLARKLLSGQ